MELLYGGGQQDQAEFLARHYGDYLHTDQAQDRIHRYTEVEMEGGQIGRVYKHVRAQTEYLQEMFEPVQWWVGDYGKGNTPPQHIAVTECGKHTLLQTSEGTAFLVFPGCCQIAANENGIWIHSRHPDGSDLDWQWWPARADLLASLHTAAFAGIDQYHDHLTFSVRQGDQITKGMLDWYDLEAFMRDFNVGHAVIDYFPEVQRARRFAERHRPGVVHRAKLMTAPLFKSVGADRGYRVGPYVSDETRLLLDRDVVYANREAYGHRHIPIGSDQFRLMAEDILFAQGNEVRDCSHLGHPYHPEWKIAADKATRNILVE